MDPTIQPYKRWKDGRKAGIILIEQHVGKDKWLTELTKEENLLKQKIYTKKSRVVTPSKFIETMKLYWTDPKSIYPRKSLR